MTARRLLWILLVSTVYCYNTIQYIIHYYCTVTLRYIHRRLYGVVQINFYPIKLQYIKNQATFPDFSCRPGKWTIWHVTMTTVGISRCHDNRCYRPLSVTPLPDTVYGVTQKERARRMLIAVTFVTSEAEGRASFRWIWEFSQVERPTDRPTDRPTVTLFSVLYLLNQATDWQTVFGIWKPQSINHSY